MNHLKGVLSAIAAMFLSLLGVEFAVLWKDAGNSKAIDVILFPMMAPQVLLLPLFWGIAVALFTLFFFAGRLSSKALRILLFWTPVVGSCTFGVAIVALFTFLWLHFRQG